MDFFKKIGNGLLFFDIFGQRMELQVNSNPRVKSFVGASFTLVIIFLCLYTFLINCIKWTKGQYLQTISSYHSYTVEKLFRQNQNLLYDFDYYNYYIDVNIRSRLANGYLLDNSQMERYFRHSIHYMDISGSIKELELEECYNRKKKIFLLEDYDPNDESRNSFRVCIKDGQKTTMGVYYDVPSQQIIRPSLYYSIHKCVNSTENNFSCRSDQEIEEMIKIADVELTLPKSTYDFKDFEHPRKRAYENKLYTLNPAFGQYYTGYLLPIVLMTDTGSFADNSELDSVDFNIEETQYQMLSSEQSPTIFVFEWKFNLNQQIYYRRNEKIYQIFANLGGTIYLLFLIGQMFCAFYNNLILKYSLINISFENLDAGLEPRPKEFNSSEEKTFKFSFFSLICPEKAQNKIYSKALNYLLEYIDIANIIKRLQDIDKLKLILFNEKQREAFEVLPKPGIGQKNSQHSALLESVTLSKKIKNLRGDPTEKYVFLLDGNLINKRMYDLIHSNRKKGQASFSESKRSLVEQTINSPEKFPKEEMREISSPFDKIPLEEIEKNSVRIEMKDNSPEK